MLLSLSVQNYALINKLEIDFQNGLTIITGETGAGKSVLLGAFSLILGQRADTGVLRDTTKNCVIEASFKIGEHNLKEFFETEFEEVEYDEMVSIRRIITPQGKSRAFINDTPVNIKSIRDLGLKLVDIHSQHENLILGNNSFQMKVVDAFAQHQKLLEEYKIFFLKYKEQSKQISDFTKKVDQSRKDYEFIQNRYNELEKTKLREDELEDLEKEISTLNHAEEIKSNLSKTHFHLAGDGDTALIQIKACIQNMQSISSFFNQAKDISARLESAYVELKDISDSAEKFSNDIEFDPIRLEEVRNRLDILYSLQQKYKNPTIKGLIAIRDEYQQKLSEIDDSDFHLEQMHKEFAKTVTKLEQIAISISKNRHKVIPKLEQSITDELKNLGILNALFKINITQSEDFDVFGRDLVEFTFSANKSFEPQEISKVISGGEMSRLMLTLKYLISKFTALPTIIFDEIDTGVSGDIADKMGQIMQKMASCMQVINITHLPQIAAKGNQHFLVHKTTENESTSTNIRLLSIEERINEIAKMLSGKDVTEAAVSNAKELLKNAVQE